MSRTVTSFFLPGRLLSPAPAAAVLCRCLLTVIVSFAPALVRAAEADAVLQVRADDWYPVNGVPDSDYPGFAIELLREIFPARGVAVDYQMSGWSRSLELVQVGDIDCVVGVYKTEAPDLLFAQTPLAFTDTAFYTRADDEWEYAGIPSLADRNVGVIADYSYGAPVDEWILHGPGNQSVQMIHGLQPLERNLRKLVSGRLDVLMESPLVMESMLDKLELRGRVREAGRMQEPAAIYLGCSARRPSSIGYLSWFDEGMAELRESGRLAEIMARYGLEVPAVAP